MQERNGAEQLKLLEERIRKDGKVRGTEVLKVDSFLNHQIDVELLNEIGKELFRLFGDCGVSKFLTDYTAALTEKLGLKPGSFVCMAAGKKTAAQTTAGVIRAMLGKRVPGHFDEEQYAICWIVDFPMYEMGEESGQLEFCHNPFSMPQGGMQALLDAEGDIEKLLAINADQYDLVVNGYESASGAVRNHNPEIMVKAFQMVGLGEEDVKAKFPAMYNAFTYGAPPHAGAAPGVDRLIMLLTGEESIREVITFPMNKNAQDLMMGAPTAVDKSQLDTVHIALIEE